MARILLLFLFFTLLLPLAASAQSQQATYTGGSTLHITIESKEGLYEYVTNNMLVRYNQNTQRAECVFNVNSLLPANDSSPVVIVQDIFFASKYPEQIIEIEAPDANAAVITAAPLQSNHKARVMFQGVPIEMTIPVSFSPDRRTLLFSTTFPVYLPDYYIPMPARYLPRLTGRIIYSIRNARWVDTKPR